MGGLGETLMKRVVKVGVALAVARQVREPPALAMNGLVGHVRNEIAETIERVMHAALGRHHAERAGGEGVGSGGVQGVLTAP